MVPCDSGHANGPLHSSEDKFKSVGGHFLCVADKRVLEGKEVPFAVLDYHTGLTQRVCRSTLAAEAAHLSDGAESAD
eukprot:4107407-Karenia_brevis.AAC.1